MSINLRKPGGTSRLANFLKQLREVALSSRVVSVVGGELRHSSRGTTIVIPTNPPRRGTGLFLRGEHVQGNTYQKGDVVVVQSGPSTGTYVCLRNGVTEAPENGLQWLALPMGPTVGEWT